jgi:hypothetical protein
MDLSSLAALGIDLAPLENLNTGQTTVADLSNAPDWCAAPLNGMHLHFFPFADFLCANEVLRFQSVEDR